MKILLRAARNPTTMHNAVDSIRRNTIGNNNGNLLFAAASHALLSVEEAQVETVASFGDKGLAERINADYQGLVLPLANCFRPGFESELKNITRTIRQLDVPFAMLSGGAQVEEGDTSFSALRSIEPTVKDFCAAVLDKSDKITVRGEVTAAYLNHLGFSAVEVIGCPSLTRMGPTFRIGLREDQFGPKIAYNVEVSKDLMGPVIARLDSSGALVTYFPQDIKTLEMMVWGREMYAAERDRQQPLHLDHRHFTDGKAVFHLDAFTWIRSLQNFDLAIGPRIHGAVSAISAGTPALLVSHDLRTRELADFHGIPQIRPNALANIKSVEDVWERMDYSEFDARRRHQVAAVVQHLETNGFTTTLSEGRATDRHTYFMDVSRLDYPSPVTSTGPWQNDERVAELRRKVVSLTENISRLDRRMDSVTKATGV